MSATTERIDFDVSDPNCFHGLEHREFMLWIKCDDTVSTYEAKYIETELGGFNGGFRFVFQMLDEQDYVLDDGAWSNTLYLFPSDFESVQLQEAPLEELRFYTLAQIDDAVRELRRNVAYDRIGHGDRGATYEKEEDFTREIKVYRIPTIREEAAQIKSALLSLTTNYVDTIDELVTHRCEHSTDDTDSYYLPCGICGSDGNA